MYKVDVYLRVRRAVMVDGMSMREAARVFGLHRDTVRKMLAYSVPPGYRRQSPPRKPKLEPYTGVIDRILEDDLRRPRKQRHTAKRIFERLRDRLGHLRILGHLRCHDDDDVHPRGPRHRGNAAAQSGSESPPITGPAYSLLVVTGLWLLAFVQSINTPAFRAVQRRLTGESAPAVTA